MTIARVDDDVVAQRATNAKLKALAAISFFAEIDDLNGGEGKRLRSARATNSMTKPGGNCIVWC